MGYFMGKWRFKNWIFPFYTTWCSYSWFLSGTIIGGSWWDLNDDETMIVDSLCILGFCFEKELRKCDGL